MECFFFVMPILGIKVHKANVEYFQYIEREKNGSALIV